MVEQTVQEQPVELAASSTSIDNRKLATVAKLAGAPMAKAAGVALQCRLNQMVDAGAPLCSIHAESPGELDYAAAYAVSDGPIFGIEAL